MIELKKEILNHPSHIELTRSVSIDIHIMITIDYCREVYTKNDWTNKWEIIPKCILP